MNFNRSDDALRICRGHLASLAAADPLIEAILTAYASAAIYSEFEAAARAIVAERSVRPGSDKHLIAFGRVAANRLIRSIKISELSGIAGHFHSDCKEAFQDAVEAETAAAWDSILNNRHGVAHENDANAPISNLTLVELQDHFERAKGVLRAFEDCLSTSSGPFADGSMDATAG